MRIASLIINHQVNAIYRSLIPMEALARRGHSVYVTDMEELRRPQHFLEYDAVFFWRCYFWPMQQLAQRLKRHHVAMVWDNDDDVSSIPRDNPAYQKTGGFRGTRATADMVRMMRLADAVTTPSAALAERYRELSGVEAHVIENYLRPSFAQPRKSPRETVNVGWLAALEHRMDYERLGLREVFLRLLDEQPHVQLTSIGLKLEIDHPRYHRVDITPYERLPRALSRLDVGIAPLADIPFNRARSNIKLKEYAAMGLPWLASPVGPYAAHGAIQGGMLVPDDGWHEALTRLVTDADLRHRLAVGGKTWAQRETIVYHVQEWEQVLRTAVRSARAAASV